MLMVITYYFARNGYSHPLADDLQLIDPVTGMLKPAGPVLVPGSFSIAGVRATFNEEDYK
jgi:hypothetical protein